MHEENHTESKKERLLRLKSIVQSLPEKPGSYQYYDQEGTIIYVGKAKNLKRRVSSYFNKEQNAKTAMLVSKIHDIKYIIVQTEEDALLLENNLIKRFQPRYNILLKDGKTYPSICITKEEFPRVFKTRRIDLKGGQYYGPYSHEPTLQTLLEVIDKLYHPRSCRQPIHSEQISANKYKVCLNYHMKRCGAPCVGLQSKEDYMQGIGECREILKGNTREILQKMREKMQILAGEMRFEEAQKIKIRHDILANFQAKSEVVQPSHHHLDVFAIESDEHNAYINYLHVVNGSIVQAYTFEYAKRIDETEEEILTIGIIEMRERFLSDSKEIVVPFAMELPLKDILVTVPQKGDKRKLLELSLLNVKQYKFDRLKQAEKLNPEQRTVRQMEEIKRLLQLPSLPLRIELFDNSNISGADAVAACVVYEKLKPCKKDYRKYNIKTVVGADDYASMQEVVRRRYLRMMEEQTPLPDLIITDGGIGQMNCVRSVVEDELHLQIPIAGLAKNNHHRTNELLFGFPPQVVGLKTDSEVFHLFTRMQDEVHRFAITFHREKRNKHQKESELDNVRGVGEATKNLLLREFKSVKRLKEASLTELQHVLGAKKGENIFQQIHPNEQENSEVK